MNLEEKINNDIKAAMLAREQEKLEAIRAGESSPAVRKNQRKRDRKCG